MLKFEARPATITVLVLDIFCLGAYLYFCYFIILVVNDII